MAKNVLIAGASRGIGLELAKRYAEAGAHVIATARDPSRAKGLAALGVDVQPLDVTSTASAKKLAATLKDHPLHLLICNAGMLVGRGGIMDPAYTEESFDLTMKTNVFGPFNVIRECLPSLKLAVDTRRGCRVAVISSIAGSSTNAGYQIYSYCASKAAATHLTQNLAVELNRDGIVLGAFHPGWVQTEMGGSGAEITVSESVDGMMMRFDEMTSSRSGSVYSYSGEVIPP